MCAEASFTIRRKVPHFKSNTQQGWVKKSKASDPPTLGYNVAFNKDNRALRKRSAILEINPIGSNQDCRSDSKLHRITFRSDWLKHPARFSQTPRFAAKSLTFALHYSDCFRESSAPWSRSIVQYYAHKFRIESFGDLRARPLIRVKRTRWFPSGLSVVLETWKAEPSRERRVGIENELSTFPVLLRSIQ